jgi:hypothetical protein
VGLYQAGKVSEVLDSLALPSLLVAPRFQHPLKRVFQGRNPEKNPMHVCRSAVILILESSFNAMPSVG